MAVDSNALPETSAPTLDARPRRRRRIWTRAVGVGVPATLVALAVVIASTRFGRTSAYRLALRGPAPMRSWAIDRLIAENPPSVESLLEAAGAADGGEPALRVESSGELFWGCIDFDHGAEHRRIAAALGDDPRSLVAVVRACEEGRVVHPNAAEVASESLCAVLSSAPWDPPRAAHDYARASEALMALFFVQPDERMRARIVWKAYSSELTGLALDLAALGDPSAMVRATAAESISLKLRLNAFIVRPIDRLAARSLGLIPGGPPTHEPWSTSYVRDDAALASLFERLDGIDRLEQAAGDPAPEVGPLAIQALARCVALRVPGAREAAIRLFENRRDAKWLAVTLAECSSGGADEAALAALFDPEVGDRVASALFKRGERLGRDETESAVAASRIAAPRSRAEFASLLSSSETPEGRARAVELARTVLEDPHRANRDRGQALEAIAEVGPEAGEAALVLVTRISEDPNATPEIRGRAAGARAALGGHGHRVAATETLRHLLRANPADEITEASSVVGEALAAIAPESVGAIPELRAELERLADVRARNVSGARVPRKNDEPLIEEARSSLAWALVATGDADAIALGLESLMGDLEGGCYESRRILEKIGAPAAPVLPALRTLDAAGVDAVRRIIASIEGAVAAQASHVRPPSSARKRTRAVVGDADSLAAKARRSSAAQR